MRREKKTIIVSVSRELTREEIRNFEKEHPGYRLSFWLRHPKKMWLRCLDTLIQEMH